MADYEGSQLAVQTDLSNKMVATEQGDKLKRHICRTVSKKTSTKTQSGLYGSRLIEERGYDREHCSLELLDPRL